MKYQLKINNLSENSASAIKVFRLIADIKLIEAKNLYEYIKNSIPCIIATGIDKEIAEHAANLLKESGLEVYIHESEFEHPMILCPKVNEKYEWNWLNGPVKK